MSDTTKEEPSSASAFPGTRWSLVIAASEGSEDSKFSALSELCEIYWYPIYAYVRRWGRNPDEAEDLTQGFLADLLRREDLGKAQQERGRMRSYLLAALKNYVTSRYHHDTRQKRGGKDLQLISIEHEVAEHRFQNEPSGDEDPAQLFDRQWAVSLMNRIYERISDENKDANQAKTFEALTPYLAGGEERGDYARISEQLDVSEASLRVSVHRLRKRYRQILEEEVLQTLSDPTQLEEEIRHLRSAFS